MTTLYLSKMPITISTHEKRRGVVQASINRLEVRLTTLEGATDRPTTMGAAKQLLSKLETLDAEYKTHHLAIVDLTDENGQEDQQRHLDDHDDLVSELTLRVQQLLDSCSSHNSESRKVPTKRLSHLQRKLAAISTGLSSLPDGDDGITLLHQYEEQLAESKIELTEARNLLYTRIPTTSSPPLKKRYLIVLLTSGSFSRRELPLFRDLLPLMLHPLLRRASNSQR